jgi:hypothetical protein
MCIRREGRRLVWLGAAVLALALWPQQALAEGCLLAPAKLSDTTIQAFKDNPKELLDRFPAGGPAMSADVMRRAGSDVALLEQIIQIAREGNTAHRRARAPTPSWSRPSSAPLRKRGYPSCRRPLQRASARSIRRRRPLTGAHRRKEPQ